MVHKTKPSTIKWSRSTLPTCLCFWIQLQKVFFNQLSTCVNRVLHTVVKGCLVYQIYQVQYFQSHKPGFWRRKIIKWSTSYARSIYRESIKYSFLKSYGKFKMCFTCVAYTDLSFLTTDEIPESVTLFIQKKISKRVTVIVLELNFTILWRRCEFIVHNHLWTTYTDLSFLVTDEIPRLYPNEFNRKYLRRLQKRTLKNCSRIRKM